MNNIKKVPTPNGRNFNGTPHLKIKRIRTEPRQRIRQLLRSFIPLTEVQSTINKSKN